MIKKKIWHKKQILKELYFNKVLTCAELSEHLKLSLPLITSLLNELIEEGCVLEKGFAPSKGGRRPLMYSIKEDMQFIVSVAMDQFVTRIAIMDMHNKFVSAVKKYELPLTENDEAVNILVQKISEFIKSSGIAKNKIAGIGIGMPGFVDGAKGVNYSFLKTDKISITDQVAKETGLPVFIDNDSSLIALAESRFGSAKKSKNAMVINVGWGVGLGLIINQELFRGYNGFAGEFSHIPLFSNDKLCSCGKRGCLETESSLKVLVQKAIEGLKAGHISSLTLEQLSAHHLEKSLEAVINAARNGDQFAVEALAEIGYNIGRGVAILIHLLNPETIILSGRGSLAGKLWLAPIQQAINEHCIPRLAYSTNVEVSVLGYEAELIGAASLVMENFKKEETRKVIPEKQYLN
jgi:glucokinase-like ROK family protein